MLSNQINFANDDFMNVLQNDSELYGAISPFDVYHNNNNNLYINHPTSPPQNITPTYYSTNHVNDISVPLSHVKVNEFEDTALSLDPVLDSLAVMDQDMMKALEGLDINIALSSPSSPENTTFITPPTDDYVKTETQAPVWPAPAQYPKKLATPVNLGELPNFVSFPPDMQVNKKLFTVNNNPDLAFFMPALIAQQQQQHAMQHPQPQRLYHTQQHQHSIQQSSLQQQQQALYEMSNYFLQQQQQMQLAQLQLQQQQQMKVHKTLSLPDDKFHNHASLYEQQPYRPYTYDDGMVPQPPKIQKVRSIDECSPEAAIKKRRTLQRRSSCPDVRLGNGGRPRSPSNGHQTRPRRTPSISSVLQNPQVEAMLSDPTLNAQVSPESRFRLLHEPNSQQRKSYQNENRYLAPSPLIVMARVPEAISGGTVTVRAVHAGDHTDFPKNVLGEPEIRQHLDEGGKAHFVMKCAETTGNQQVRLKFTVKYVSNQSLYEETIYSQAFYISSHTGKRIEQPMM